MTKKILSLLLSLLLLTTVFPAMPAAEAAASTEEEFRGVWVASVINLDYPSKAGLSVADLKSEATGILDTAKSVGFNAVILQVRPTGDALYKSDIFPWSAYLTGKQGTAPASGFDPLTFWVDEAHKRGLELHAWVNPLRISQASAELTDLSEGNPARQNPSWTAKVASGSHKGQLYFNPGLPEVRDLVVRGVAELVRNYDIDGVHYDDYFYPEVNFADNAAYQKYGSGFSSVEDWRRDNINKLIETTQETVKSIRSDCAFGVAPVAIWANKKTNALGSDTNGQQSYYEQYADTRKWVKNEWLDYIAPQIYWNIGKTDSDYAKVLQWWADTVKGTDVSLYVGHATWLLDNQNVSSPWYGTQEISRQIALNRSYPEVKGSVHFRYSFIAKNAAIQAALMSIYDGEGIPASGVPATDPQQSLSLTMPAPDKLGDLYVGRPSGNITTPDASFFFVGASNPTMPLTVNGDAVTTRTAKGYFSYYAKLKSGANTFVFAQGDQQVTRVVTCSSASSSSGGGTAASPPQMSRAEIVSGSMVPGAYDEIRKPGETVALKCTAPIGATVTVRVNGKTYAMTPAAKTKPNDGKLYSTTYTYTYQLPQYTVTKKLITVGTPVFIMKMGDEVSMRIAPTAIKCLTEGAPLLAEVVSGNAFAYPGAATSGGPVSDLVKGQVANVTSITSSWIGLNNGLYVQRADVRISARTSALKASVSAASYALDSKWETLSLTMGARTVSKTSFDGKKLTWTVSLADKAPSVSLPNDSLFSAVKAEVSGGNAVYTLTLRDGKRLDGYYVDTTDKGLALKLKRSPAAQKGAKPLTGITIVLDAGHGGSEPGAPGAWGTQYGEKTINLYAELKLRTKLQALGATVIVTREDDKTVSLAERVEINRAARPDLFLSLHCNSLDYAVDATNVRGSSGWYREKTALELSTTLLSTLQSDLGVGKRGSTQSNLYVCRPTWTPSMILEMGFLCNAADYEWLSDDASLEKLMTSVAAGIVQYFS